jgi:hypothetical protein
MRILIATSIFFLLALSAALGQTTFSLENNSGYITNAFANYAALPDYYSSIGAEINHDWLGENNGLRLFYDGSYTAFNAYNERNNHSHEAGVVWYSLLGETGNRIDAGANIGKRFHSEIYQWYEQEQLQAFASIKYVVNPQWFAYTGFSLNLRSYPELTPFSHSRTLFYGRSSWFFATGTTLIAEADLMRKSYTSAADGTQEAYTDMVTVGDGSSTQLLLLLRAAQGVTQKIGLSAEYQLRHNFSSTSRYLGNADGFYYSDEELFEDVFAYHGSTLLLSYRQELPWAMRLTLSSRYEQKSFDERQAADLLGNPYPDGRLRDDERTSISFEWQKALRVKTGWAPLMVELNWSLLKNSSNDLYYNYKSSYWGLGLSCDL